MPSNKTQNCLKYLALLRLYFFALKEARALAEQELVARKKQANLLLLYFNRGQILGQKVKHKSMLQN